MAGHKDPDVKASLKLALANDAARALCQLAYGAGARLAIEATAEGERAVVIREGKARVPLPAGSTTLDAYLAAAQALAGQARLGPAPAAPKSRL